MVPVSKNLYNQNPFEESNITKANQPNIGLGMAKRLNGRDDGPIETNISSNAGNFGMSIFQFQQGADKFKHNELVARCMRQLSQNKFLQDFKIICDTLSIAKT